MGTPTPREDKEKFSEKRIRKEGGGSVGGGEKKSEKDMVAAASGWAPVSCAVSKQSYILLRPWSAGESNTPLSETLVLGFIVS